MKEDHIVGTLADECIKVVENFEEEIFDSSFFSRPDTSYKMKQEFIKILKKAYQH